MAEGLDFDQAAEIDDINELIREGEEKTRMLELIRLMNTCHQVSKVQGVQKDTRMTFAKLDALVLKIVQGTWEAPLRRVWPFRHSAPGIPPP